MGVVSHSLLWLNLPKNQVEALSFLVWVEWCWKSFRIKDKASSKQAEQTEFGFHCQINVMGKIRKDQNLGCYVLLLELLFRNLLG